VSTTTRPATARPVAKKTAAKKTAAKKSAAPAARKAAPAKTTGAGRTTAQRTSARPAAKKKPTRKPPAKTIGKKAMRTAKFAWDHPFLATVGVLAVTTTVLHRGVLRPTGRLLALTGGALAAGGKWALLRGREYIVRRRGTAKPLTTGQHAHCKRCKGTGTLPRHDALGRFLGSISCTG
jgi:hypothetical protein